MEGRYALGQSDPVGQRPPTPTTGGEGTGEEESTPAQPPTPAPAYLPMTPVRNGQSVVFVVVVWLLLMVSTILGSCVVRDIRPPKCDPGNRVPPLLEQVITLSFAHAAMGNRIP